MEWELVANSEKVIKMYPLEPSINKSPCTEVKTNIILHNLRLVCLVQKLSKYLCLNKNLADDLSIAAGLHDIGKFKVPYRILSKSTRLTPSEWQEIKRHSYYGYIIAESYGLPRRIKDAILYHHERWDGKGYPKGLKKYEIPLYSRIIAIVDAYDAMVSKRCYRNQLSHNEALKEIAECSGTQFDPDLSKNFVKCMKGV